MNNGKRTSQIDDLYEIQILGDAQLNPDAARVAYVRSRMDRKKDDYITNVWLWEDGQDRQYTFGDKDSSPRWSPNGKNLAFLSKRGTGSKARLCVMNAEGGEAQPLTDETWEISSIGWSPSSDKIAFVRSVPSDEFGAPKPTDDDVETEADTDTNHKTKKKTAPAKISERIEFKADGVGFVQDRRRHIYVLNVATGTATQITDGDYNDDSPSWSPDGKYIVFASNRNPRWDTEIDSQIWEVPSDGGECRRVTIEIGTWSRPVYSPDGDYLACTGHQLRPDTPVTGFERLWRLDRTTGGMTDLTGDSDIETGNSVITDIKHEAQAPFIWNERGIWFLAAEAGASNIFCWNTGLNRVTEGLHDIRDFTVAGDAVAFTLSDLLHPAEIYLRHGSDQREQITNANKEYLDAVQLSEPEPVHFAGSNGEDVNGWLMQPLSGETPHPLIIYIHGGPQAAYGDAFFHEMQVLAAEGFGILLINPHGSGSLGEAWLSSIHGGWGNRDFQDVMAAADMVSALEWVDENRLGIGGGSYGGYMTAWVIGHTKRFAGAVIDRSLVNMLSFVGTTDVPNWWEYAWLATIQDDPMKLWSTSPIAYLGDMTTPSLIVHSENDHRCPIEQGEQIFTGLRKRGVPTRFVRFPDESHGLSRGGKPSRRTQRLQEILSWFDRYVAKSSTMTP